MVFHGAGFPSLLMLVHHDGLHRQLFDLHLLAASTAGLLRPHVHPGE